MTDQGASDVKYNPPTADSRKMYTRLRVMRRLGLLGPILRLHRRIDPR